MKKVDSLRQRLSRTETGGGAIARGIPQLAAVIRAEQLARVTGGVATHSYCNTHAESGDGCPAPADDCYDEWP